MAGQPRPDDAAEDGPGAAPAPPSRDRLARGRRSLGRRFPRLALGVGGLWSTWWFGVAAAVVGNGINDVQGLGATIGATAMTAALGALGLVLVRDALREFRSRRSEDQHLEAAVERAARSQAADQLRADLPEDVREVWDRLTAATALADDLSSSGWVDHEAVAALHRERERLHALLVVDRRTDAVGGSPSRGPRDALDQLSGLVVALCDEAVEHQHARHADGQVPATLQDARERLAAGAEAYRELEGW